MRLTPSSSSMISFPIEANVVHLQLLVALTAHLLWALNLHTAREKYQLYVWPAVTLRCLYDNQGFIISAERNMR